MGFWGTLLVVRDPRPLAELQPDVPALADARLHFTATAAPWRVDRIRARLPDLPAAVLSGLSAVTDAPVLAADVLDSDAARIHAVGRRTPDWSVWLQVDRAVGFFDLPRVPDDRVVSPAVAAEAAVAWARDAGLDPAPAADVRRAMMSSAVFVEETFDAVLSRLGLAPAPQAPRPRIVDVLRDLVGRQLSAVDAVPHRSGDLRLRFDDHDPVTVCLCSGDLTLYPSDGLSEDAGQVASPTDAGHHGAVAPLVGRPVTGAATIRRGYGPELAGVALRLGDQDLFLTATPAGSGTVWTVARHRAREVVLVPQGPGLRVNPWLA